MPKIYINVAYEDRDLAKRLGARWDPSVRRWYCAPGTVLAKVFSWRKPPAQSAAALGSREAAALSEFSGSARFKPASHIAGPGLTASRRKPPAPLPLFA